MTWFQLWTICWQVAIFLTPIVIGAAVLWLRSQFVTKVEFTAERNRIDAKFDANRIERDARYETLSTRIIDHETRLKMAEVEVAKPPSRHQLNNELAKVHAGLHSVGRSMDDLRHHVESQVADMRRQGETLNQYLHTLVEKEIRK